MKINKWTLYRLHSTCFLPFLQQNTHRTLHYRTIYCLSNCQGLINHLQYTFKCSNTCIDMMWYTYINQINWYNEHKNFVLLTFFHFILKWYPDMVLVIGTQYLIKNNSACLILLLTAEISFLMFLCQSNDQRSLNNKFCQFLYFL